MTWLHRLVFVAVIAAAWACSSQSIQTFNSPVLLTYPLMAPVQFCVPSAQMSTVVFQLSYDCGNPNFVVSGDGIQVVQAGVKDLPFFINAVVSTGPVNPGAVVNITFDSWTGTVPQSCNVRALMSTVSSVALSDAFISDSTFAGLINWYTFPLQNATAAVTILPSVTDSDPDLAVYLGKDLISALSSATPYFSITDGADQVPIIWPGDVGVAGVIGYRDGAFRLQIAPMPINATSAPLTLPSVVVTGTAAVAAFSIPLSAANGTLLLQAGVVDACLAYTKRWVSVGYASVQPLPLQQQSLTPSFAPPVTLAVAAHSTASDRVYVVLSAFGGYSASATTSCDFALALLAPQQYGGGCVTAETTQGLFDVYLVNASASSVVQVYPQPVCPNFPLGTTLSNPDLYINVGPAQQQPSLDSLALAAYRGTAAGGEAIALPISAPSLLVVAVYGRALTSSYNLLVSPLPVSLLVSSSQTDVLTQQSFTGQLGRAFQLSPAVGPFSWLAVLTVQSAPASVPVLAQVFNSSVVVAPGSTTVTPFGPFTAAQLPLTFQFFGQSSQTDSSDAAANFQFKITPTLVLSVGASLSLFTNASVFANRTTTSITGLSPCFQYYAVPPPSDALSALVVQVASAASDSAQSRIDVFGASMQLLGSSASLTTSPSGFVKDPYVILGPPEFAAATGQLFIKVSVPSTSADGSCDVLYSCAGCILSVTPFPIQPLAADAMTQLSINTATDTLMPNNLLLFAFPNISTGFFASIAGNVLFASNAPTYTATPAASALTAAPVAINPATSSPIADCSGNTRTPLLLVRCPAGKCSASVFMFTSPVRLPSLMQFASALGRPRIAARDRQDFFVTLTDPATYEWTNVRVYNATSFQPTTTLYGFSVAQLGTATVVGVPLWPSQLPAVWQATANALTIAVADSITGTTLSFMESCAADMGALVSATEDARYLLTTVSNREVAFIDYGVNASRPVVAAIFVLASPDVPVDGLQNLTYIGALSTRNRLAAALMATNIYGKGVRLTVFPFAYDSAAQQWTQARPLDLPLLPGIQFTSQHFLDIHDAGVAAVAVPELNLALVVNITSQHLTRITFRNASGLPADPTFASFVALLPDASGVLVTGSNGVYAFALDGRPLWLLPDTMQLEGNVWAYPSPHALVFDVTSAGPQELVALLNPLAPPGGEFGALQSTPAGMTWDAARLAAVPCPVGTFKPRDSIESCALCPAGTYQNTTGARFCLPCAANGTCPTGAVAPVSSTYAPSWQLFPFQVESTTANAEEVLTRSLFLPQPGNPFAYILWSWTAFLIVTAVFALLPAVCGWHRSMQYRVLWVLARVDHAKEIELDVRKMRVKHTGGTLGGLLSLWIYGVMLLGLSFSVVYATSYAPCLPPPPVGFDQVFGSPYVGSAATLTPNFGNTPPDSYAPLGQESMQGYCPSMANANVLRQLQLLPSSTEPSDVVGQLYYLRHSKNLTVGVELLGFRRLAGDCASLCSQQQVTLSTQGCVAAGVACATSMDIVCETLDSVTCRVSASLPPLHSVEDSSQFVLSFPPDVSVTALVGVVYMQAANTQTSYGRVQTFESWARMVQPPPSDARSVIQGNVTLQTYYLAGVRQTTVSTGTNTTGFVLFFVPPTISGGTPVATALHTSAPLAVTLQLIDRGNWVLQSEQPQLSNVVLLFTIGIALISTFSLMSELTGVVHTVAHWVKLYRRRKFPLLTAMRAADMARAEYIRNASLHHGLAGQSVYGVSSVAGGSVAETDDSLSQFRSGVSYMEMKDDGRGAGGAASAAL